jgi:hypothetical protein
MKNKVEHSKKGINTLFFRNTAQGQPTSKEPRMTETVEQKPMKKPIQCWGCGGDHMHKDFPQRGDKVRDVHNVQHTATIEDMGINVHRIYATLNNKHPEFQSAHD